jgi:signal transduction histidine kinase
MAHEGDKTTTLWDDLPTLLTAAHELKAPLVLIRQLSFELDRESDPEIARQIRLTAERSLRLVESLTKVARLEDTLFPIEPLDVGDVYRGVAEEMRPLSRALNQRIEIDISRKTPHLLGNRSLLHAALVGLCDNALRHNRSGEPVVLQARAKVDHTIQVGVRDYGQPIKSLRHIKRQLGVSPQPMSSRPGSSGLGLLIAEQFARHMDASLELTKHRGGGATFSLRLPVSKQLSLLELL